MLAKDTFFKGYDMIFEMELSIYAKMVYFYLSKCKNNDNTCFPCHFTIAKNCSCGVTKVKEAIKELVAHKLLLKEERYTGTKKGKNSQTSNLYTVYNKPQEIEIENKNEIEEQPKVEPVKIEMVQAEDNVVPFEKPIEKENVNLTTRGQSQDDYRTGSSFNLTSKPSRSIYLSNQDHKAEMMEDLNSVFVNSQVSLYDKPYKNMITATISSMFCDDSKQSFSAKHRLPLRIIQSHLKELTLETIDYAIYNYKQELESGKQIHSPNKYFAECLWTAILDYPLSEIGLYSAV